jgi:hypothetical protein
VRISSINDFISSKSDISVNISISSSRETISPPRFYGQKHI